MYQHKLEVRHDQPYICHTYPMYMALPKFVGSEIESLTKAGKIRLSNSPYNNNPLGKVTKNGDIREMILRTRTPFTSSNYLRQQVEVGKLEQAILRKGFPNSLIILLSV